jgi:hypothetical protein
MPRADKIRLTGVYTSRGEAAESLQIPGDTALVRRGVARILLMNCPCTCGDLLVINLDPRAGPAWRIYRRGAAVSLYPSYWRDTKCQSHFILWRNQIHWCDWDDEWIWTSSNSIEKRVLELLTDQFVNYENIADKLQEVPWDVLQACRSLVRKGSAVRNTARRSGEFRVSDLKH